MTTLEESLTLVKDWLAEANLIAFFGGAGVSTESGLPDYRSQDGQYSKMEAAQEDPRKIMNRRYIMTHPEKFFNRSQSERPQVIEPNPAHRVLAEWEKAGKDVRIITQNVDGLHQKAGHRFVIELHGNGRTWHCMDCGRVYLPNEAPRDDQNIPRCYVDQGIVRPSVIFFGENPKADDINRSIETIKAADVLIVAGTSLSVYPAKNLINHFEGKRVIVINREPLILEKLSVDAFIQGEVGQIFAQLNKIQQAII